jgi:hypothetical protein
VISSERRNTFGDDAAGVLGEARMKRQWTGNARLLSQADRSQIELLPPPDLVEIRDAWRRVQVRQLFRLSLEALLHWTVMKGAGQRP